ncbi:hypothetical protein Q8A73_011198 [Channa argus]|nr:hypothetical protein Q8A73_011198 [Channa argus]
MVDTVVDTMVVQCLEKTSEEATAAFGYGRPPGKERENEMLTGKEEASSSARVAYFYSFTSMFLADSSALDFLPLNDPAMANCKDERGKEGGRELLGSPACSQIYLLLRIIRAYLVPKAKTSSHRMAKVMKSDLPACRMAEGSAAAAANESHSSCLPPPASQVH